MLSRAWEAMPFAWFGKVELSGAVLFGLNETIEPAAIMAALSSV
jgi:hypothetical protein